MKPLTVTVNPTSRILRIDLWDELSALPSVTNRRIIVRGRLIKEPTAQRRISELTYLFRSETRLIQPLTQFCVPVHVTAILAERFDKRGRRMPRWDSHNMCKVIGDWIEDLGIISDDCDAEIQCVKRKDYLQNPDARNTVIIIQPLCNVHPLISSQINHAISCSLQYQPPFKGGKHAKV